MKYFRRGSYSRPRMYIERALRSRYAKFTKRRSSFSTYPRARINKGGMMTGPAAYRGILATARISPFPVNMRPFTATTGWTVDTTPTAGAGTVGGEIKWRLNDLHQPLDSVIPGGPGYNFANQFQSLYKRYWIHTAHVEVNVRSRNNDTEFPATIYFVARDHDQYSTTFFGKGALDIPGYQHITQIDIPEHTANTGCRFQRTYRLCDIDGISWANYYSNYELNGALMGVSPTQFITFCYGVFTKNGVAGVTVSTDIKITVQGHWLHLNNGAMN